MARFYLDENVPEGLARALNDIGHDALTAKDVGRKGFRDHEQLLYATDEERAIVTFNGDDFTLLHDLWRALADRWRASGPASAHFGIVVIEPGSRAPAAVVGTVRLHKHGYGSGRIDVDSDER